MKFSVVIPTLRRSDTLRHALSTAAAQNYDQLEIIVQNNGNDLATQLVVHEFNDSRVKLFYTDVVLPMTNNWESAIRHCSGDYITFLGDDDALLDNACSMAAEILDESNIDLLSWAPFAYYWPSYVHASQLSNHLLGYIPSEKKVRTLDSKKMLRRFYKFEVHYSRLPMIYNSFVSRSIVSKITHEVGRYFIGLLPDVASGITNAIYSDRYLRLNFPLSISGTSHHSTGHNMLMSARGTDREDDIRRDFGEYRLDPRLPSNHHVDLAVANDMLAIKDNLLKDDSTTELDFAGLVKRLVENINDRPDFYEETLAAAKLLASQHSVDLDGLQIPPRGMRKQIVSGVRAVSATELRFTIDGTKIGLRHIGDAVSLASQMLPAAPLTREQSLLSDRNPADEPSSLPPPRLAKGEPMSFAASEPGVAALRDGWSRPERWGTWSIGERASLCLKVPRDGGRSIALQLRHRSNVSAGHPGLVVTCSVSDRVLDTWECTASRFAVTRRLKVPRDVVGPDGEISIDFKLSGSRSPADLGLSSDRRNLGIGVEWIKSESGASRFWKPGWRTRRT